jgi:hypothetical protein
LGHEKPAHKKHGGAAGGLNDVRMKRSNTSEDDLRAEGGQSPKRYKAGGKVPKIKVDVHGGPHLHVHPPMGGMGGAGPTPGAAPGMPAPGGPMPPAGAMAMQGPPPGPAALPMRAGGGHVPQFPMADRLQITHPMAGHAPMTVPAPFKKGGKVVMGEDPPEDISNYRQARERKAQGGKIKAGTATGVSRLEAAEQMKHRD